LPRGGGGGVGGGGGGGGTYDFKKSVLTYISVFCTLSFLPLGYA
jgi:hypothetical protein